MITSKKEYMRKYRAENREKLNEYRTEYDTKNKEEVLLARRIWSSENKDRLRQKGRELYQTKYKSTIREKNLMKDFGLTVADYDRILAAQGGYCAICQGGPDAKGKTFAVDHDHFTGKVRGILCRGCNVGIGNLKEDPEILKYAYRYLTEPRGTTL